MLVIDSHSQQSIQAERAKRSFSLFVKDAWHVIEPSTPFVDGWHISAICDHLQAVSSSHITRLLVNMPPRHAKSTLISVLWPMWCWVSNPSIRWLCASYALSLAIRDNRKCRLLIQSSWFQRRYGHIFKLSGDQNVKGRFENDKRGYRLAVSVGSAATGEGGDILLIDDAHAIDDSTSDPSRLSTLQWFDETWSSRLNSQEYGAMVVVGQRIHQQDISGHILELGDWEHLNLPTEYEPARKCFTSIGWSDPRKREGELLWPTRFNADILARLRHQIGTIAYAAQYQQTPVPSGGGQFRREWFRYFQATPDAYLCETPAGVQSVLKSLCWQFATVDLAISSKQSADFTVIAVWAVSPGLDLILTDLVRGHFDNPTQQEQIALINSKHIIDYFKVEEVAYQLALIQQLIARGIPCRGYKPVRDKVSRATTASVWFENGKFYFPKHAPYLNDVESELLMFPKAAHDDIVDVISMAAEEVTSQPLPHIYTAEDYEPSVEEQVHPFVDALSPLPLARVNIPDPFAWASSHLEGWGGDDS